MQIQTNHSKISDYEQTGQLLISLGLSPVLHYTIYYFVRDMKLIGRLTDLANTLQLFGLGYLMPSQSAYSCTVITPPISVITIKYITINIIK